MDRGEIIMKKVLLLVLVIASCLSAQAGESLKFPFNRNPEITFLRYNSDGAIFSIKQESGQWKKELKDRATHKTIKTENITTEKANEILRAFSSLYYHWHDQPEMSSGLKPYSMSVWIKNPDWPWVSEIRVRDAGSKELKYLKDLIGFTE